MTKFSWRRESSLTTSVSLKMDYCLVLTECFNSRRVLRFRTSPIDLIHSDKVSTSTSSFFAHRLACSSHASMIMPKFWCHEFETGFLYFGPLLKRSHILILRTILRSPVTIWSHGAYRNFESEQMQGWDHGKDLESRVAPTGFVIEHFGSNRTGIAIGNAWRLLVLIVRRDLFLAQFWFRMLLTLKASMPLFANLTFRNGWFLVSVGS